MTRHVMIVGCGRLGATAANALLDRGDRVTILDMDAENFRRLRPRVRLSMYVGDGTSHEVLRRTGIESVGAFIAVTGRDTTNALAAQSARTLRSASSTSSAASTTRPEVRCTSSWESPP